MSRTYGNPEARGTKGRRRIEYGAGAGSWDWRAVGAIFGLSGGIMSVLIGSVLTALSWLPVEAGAGSDMRTTGTVLLALTILLLVFGAHCLDLTEKRKIAERERQFK